MITIKRYLILAVYSGAFTLAAHADKVRIEEIPLQIRDKIKAQTGGAVLDDIDREVRGGRTFYEVALKQNGKNSELLFDDQGQLQNAPGGPLDSRKITYDELPPVVQRIAQARLKGAAPNDIDRRVKNGDVSYEIGFKQGEQQQELVISQDGRILQDVQLSSSSVAAASTPTQLSNKRKVNFDQLPAAVKQTVTASAHGATIEDVEQGQWRARTIYEVAFKDQGRHVELQLDESGRVVHDPRQSSPTAAGNPAIVASGAATSRAYPDVNSAVPLSTAEKVDRRSVPAAVEQTLRKVAVGASIEDVERGSWRGINVYEVAFKDQGRHVELQIDEKGNVVFDPRSAK